MIQSPCSRFLLFAGTAAVLLASPCALRAQARGDESPNPRQVAVVEAPDAQRTASELSELLQHYPPGLETVLALDPSLLTNRSYMGSYPALAAFVDKHPEVVRNPSFYFHHNQRNEAQEHTTEVINFWQGLLGGLAALIAFGMAIGVAVWLIRLVVDYRRWNRLTTIQKEVHTKLLDRLTSNDELLAYIQSPAGAKFLESAPISLEAGPRVLGAPFSRILWSVQVGLVLIAGGLGLQFISGRFVDEAAQPLHAIGIIGVALGIGFAASAFASYVISRRFGLLDRFNHPARVESTPI